MDFHQIYTYMVNLIGEHIDYCGYGVCPMAIEQDIILAVSTTAEDCILHLANLEKKYQPYTTSLNNFTIKADGTPQWYDYVLCGIKGVLESSPDTKSHGMKIVVSGTIPECAGLSSSSALVSAAALATAYMLNLKFSKESLADLCAKCEKYIGTQGGGMDQAIAFLANEGCAKFIEFSPLRSKDICLPEEATFVIAHSLAEFNKAATQDFNCRVAECRLAAQVIAKIKKLPWKDIKKLKDVQDILGADLPTMINLVEEILRNEPYSKQEIVDILDTTVANCNIFPSIPDTVLGKGFKLKQRALHVFQEALRVEEFIATCNQEVGESALPTLGRLMYESHASLQKLYECSHPMLDKLVEISKKYAIGARLTGAGWGGCTVALVLPENLSKHVENLRVNFYKEIGRDENNSSLFITSPNNGACIYLQC